MENHEFCVKIDNKEIKFYDEELFENNPSSFEIMMDFIPVYFAYKYIKEKNDNQESKKTIEAISERLSYLSYYYRSIKILEKNKNLINSLVSEKYISFIQKQGTILTEILNDSTYWRYHISDETYDIPNSISLFLDNFHRTLRELTYDLFYPRSDRYYLIDENFDLFQRTLYRELSSRFSIFSITEILQSYVHIFIEKTELFFLEFHNLHKEFNTLFHKKNSSIHIGNNNIEYTAFFLSAQDKSLLLKNKKDFLANTIKLIPNSFNSFKAIKQLDIEMRNKSSFSKKKKKYSIGTGCFAIMEDSKTNIYYALSGTKAKEKGLDSLCNQLNSLFTGVPYTRCTVTTDMIRYKQCKQNNYHIISPIQIRFQDEQAKGPVDQREYTCCERKILACPDIPDNNNTFFIRWAPCDQCRPAIHYRYKQIFAFAEKSGQNHPYNNTELTEFHVVKSIDFDLEKKAQIKIP